MDSYTCQFDPPKGGCPKNISNWIDYDPVLSWVANFFIALIAIALLWWLVWFLFFYLRRPRCGRCEQEGKRVRTTIKGSGGEPLCHTHLIDQRRRAAEKRAEEEDDVFCGRHDHLMAPTTVQLGNEFIIINICPEGCQFHDAGESEKLAQHARSQGYRDGHSAGSSSGISTGMAQGFAIGMIINPN